MATYLVTWEEPDMAGYFVFEVEAKSQREAAEQSMTKHDMADVNVYTLAKGSPVSTFRRRTETVTVLERVSDNG